MVFKHAQHFSFWRKFLQGGFAPRGYSAVILYCNTSFKTHKRCDRLRHKNMESRAKAMRYENHSIKLTQFKGVDGER